MKRLAKRSVLVAGRRTSVRLGSAMWEEALHEIAHETGISVDALVTEIDRKHQNPKLDAATRSYVVAYYRARMQAALRGDTGNLQRIAAA